MPSAKASATPNPPFGSGRRVLKLVVTRAKVKPPRNSAQIVVVGADEATPPWRQPRGKSEDNLPQTLPLRCSICTGVGLRNYRFAPGLSPGWCAGKKAGLASAVGEGERDSKTAFRFWLKSSKTSCNPGKSQAPQQFRPTLW